MIAKNIIYSDDARYKLQQGVQKLTDAVKVTMGPRGRNVLLQKNFKSVLTKDGVSVAEEVYLKDTVENMGAQLVKEVARNTAEEAGDGTTTATVLANAIFKEGLRNITAGANPVEVKRGMDKCTSKLLENLKLNSKEVTSELEIEQVATISANSDTKVGKMIAEAITAVGRDGVITVEESKGIEDSIDTVEGMQFAKGFLSPYFVTDTTKLETELTEPFVLLYNSKINHLKEILPVLEKIQAEKKSLLIICNDIDDEALNTLVLNKMRNILEVCVVKSPGYGGTTKAYLEDIAILTSGKVIDPEGDVYFNDVSQELGKCEKVVVQKDSTIVIGGTAVKGTIEARCEVIKEQIKTENEPYFNSILKERLAKLSGGIAVIKVSAPSDTEMKERKDRIDDALGATRAAQEEGIIIGGGAALIKASFDVNDLGLEGDEKIGAEIVLRAIKAPLKQIVENAGYDSGVIINNVLSFDDEYTTKTTGFNASEGEYQDMYEAGIIDSFKVCRVALTNAVSVSSMLLTTECVISKVEIKE